MQWRILNFILFAIKLYNKYKMDKEAVTVSQAD